jgi:hypothetical protein
MLRMSVEMMMKPIRLRVQVLGQPRLITVGGSDLLSITCEAQRWTSTHIVIVASQAGVLFPFALLLYPLVVGQDLTALSMHFHDV